MSFSVNTAALSYALVSDAAPPGHRVESRVPADSGDTLPLVIVSASAPTSVANHRAEMSAQFTMAVSCYSRDRSEAWSACDAIYGQIIQAWRSRTVTDYGWISHVGNDSQHPTYVASDLEADDVHRFDCTLPVIARH